MFQIKRIEKNSSRTQLLLFTSYCFSKWRFTIPRYCN